MNVRDTSLAQVDSSHASDIGVIGNQDDGNRRRAGDIGRYTGADSPTAAGNVRFPKTHAGVEIEHGTARGAWLEPALQVGGSDGGHRRECGLAQRLCLEAGTYATLENVCLTPKLLQPARDYGSAHGLPVDQHDARVAHRHPLIRRLYELSAWRVYGAG